MRKIKCICFILLVSLLISCYENESEVSIVNNSNIEYMHNVENSISPDIDINETDDNIISNENSNISDSNPIIDTTVENIHDTQDKSTISFTEIDYFLLDSKLEDQVGLYDISNLLLGGFVNRSISNEYINIYRGLNHVGLYKINLKNKEACKMTDYGVKNISFSNNWIYYIRINKDNHIIERIYEPTGETQSIYSGNINSLSVADDILFFIEDRELVKIDLDNNTISRLDDFKYWNGILMDNSFIFEDTNYYIWNLNLLSGNYHKITEMDITSSYTIFDGNLYFNEGTKFYQVSLKGDNEKLLIDLGEDIPTSFIIQNDHFYCSTASNKLVIFDLNGKLKKVVNNGVDFHFIGQTTDYVYGLLVADMNIIIRFTDLDNLEYIQDSDFIN